MSRAATPEALQAVQRAAAERKRQSRRFEPRSHGTAGPSRAALEGRTLDPVDWRAPAFTPPGDLGEWLDDRLTERNPWSWGDPVTAVLFGILEAAREGDARAVQAAVSDAKKRLDDGSQYRAWLTLSHWRGRNDPVAVRAMDAVAGDWRRLGLKEKRPDDE